MEEDTKNLKNVAQEANNARKKMATVKKIVVALLPVLKIMIPIIIIAGIIFWASSAWKKIIGESSNTNGAKQGAIPTPVATVQTMGSSSVLGVTSSQKYQCLVNKSHHLEQDTEKAIWGVSDIDSSWTKVSDYAGGLYLEPTAASQLCKLFDAAIAAGALPAEKNAQGIYKLTKEIAGAVAGNDVVNSAHRRYKPEANEGGTASIAAQGESEHQLGLSVDLIKASSDKWSDGNIGSNNKANSSDIKWVFYNWMMDHAAEYGFILRYPKGANGKTYLETGYNFEAWHWRYVGDVTIAQTIMSKITSEGSNYCFEDYVHCTCRNSNEYCDDNCQYNDNGLTVKEPTNGHIF